MLNRLLILQLLSPTRSGYKTFHTTCYTLAKKRTPFTAMSAISDNEIISRLSKLSISHGEVITHGAVKGGGEWKAELDKLSKGDVGFTKTVSSPLPL